MSKWQWLLVRFFKRLWVRTSLFCILAVVTALLAVQFKAFIPEDVAYGVGAKSVDNLLQIIASSMLAVTIFSLSTMVAAITAATTNTTPRSTQLLLDDNTAQNALSTFIGAFLFSLVGIVALYMGIYGESGRLILFAVTVGVIILIVMVLIRWINYLSQLGRVGKTIDTIENAALNAMRDRIENPHLGAKQLKNYTPQKNHAPLVHRRIGYVQHIDIGALDMQAQEHDVEIFVTALPGTFNDGVKPLAHVSGKLTDSAIDAMHKHFSIGDDRSFEQDPRFGLIVLSEIASRALSPAVNDPGTAIDIIGTGLRVLEPWLRNGENKKDVRCKRIHVPSLKLSDMLDDLYTPIARDGAAVIEVGIRLQKAFASIAAIGDEEAKTEAKRYSAISLKRAEAALAIQEDKKILADIVSEKFGN